jgi:hypothetical protein
MADGNQTNDLPSLVTLSTIMFITYFMSILQFCCPHIKTNEVNILFEAVNEFKRKSCQPQSFITFEVLQLLF